MVRHSGGGDGPMLLTEMDGATSFRNLFCTLVVSGGAHWWYSQR